MKIINQVIAKKLKNINVHDQEKVDNILIRLDGTKQKKTWCQHYSCKYLWLIKNYQLKLKKVELYKTFFVKNFKLPYPLMNIINGGAHANNGLQIQEFMIRPDKQNHLLKL